MCRNPCIRQLICGHICQSLCSQACRPCKAQCRLRCDHANCTNLCGRPCSPCPVGCRWKCPHSSCDPHPCFQLCNRQPCQLACIKLLSCRHPCPSLCGEICPPPSGCPTCHSMDRKTIIYLPDCGHCVSVQEMENPVELLQGPPSCPRCKEPLTAVWGRYGDRVKIYHYDIVAALKAHDRDWQSVLEQSICRLLDRHAPDAKIVDALRSALRGKGKQFLY